MIISQPTIEILKNFHLINPSILISPGNSLMTLAPSNGIFAEATVPDTFPQEFGIHELLKFLGILSLDKNTDIEFHEKYMIMKQEYGNTKYIYCEPMAIKHTKKTPLPITDPIVKFELKAEVYNNIRKAMSVLEFSEMVICGENGLLSIDSMNVVAEKKGKDYSNRFTHSLGPTTKEFMAVIEASSLLMISSDYTVTISKKMGCAHFYTTLKNGVKLQYWIVLNGTKSDLKNV